MVITLNSLSLYVLQRIPNSVSLLSGYASYNEYEYIKPNRHRNRVLGSVEITGSRNRVHQRLAGLPLPFHEAIC